MKKIFLVLLHLTIWCEAVFSEASSFSINFDDFPYAKRIENMADTSWLNEDDFLMFMKIPEMLLYTKDKSSEEAREYCKQRYGYDLDRIIYIGVKITYVYEVLFESGIKDDDAYELCFKLLHASIRPTDTEKVLFRKYLMELREAKNLIRIRL